MDVDGRADGRKLNQLRPLTCSQNLLNRAHGSARWSQGDTIVLAAVYGPKAGTKKGENPEKASIEVIWKPKTGQIGREEKEYEMVLKRTLQSICLLTVHPNTTTSIIVQDFSHQFSEEAGIILYKYVHQIVTSVKWSPQNLQVIGDNGALLPCAINASCAALVDAGIPLKHLAVAVCCGLTAGGHVILDPTVLEEKKMKAVLHLVFPNPSLSIHQKPPHPVKDKAVEQGTITSVTRGAMSVSEYEQCLQFGGAACVKISEFLRKSLQSQAREGLEKAI